MSNQGPLGTPGVKATRTTGDLPAVITNPVYLPGGGLINGAISRDTGNTGDADVIRRGTLLRRVSGKWTPALFGLLPTTHDTSVATTALSVGTTIAAQIEKYDDDGAYFFTGGVIGAPTAATGVVCEALTAITAIAAGVLTLTTAPAVDLFAGGVLTPFATNPRGTAADGEDAFAALDEQFAILDDMSGVKVTDVDDNDIDSPAMRLAIGGTVDIASIPNMPADVFTRRVIASAINGSPGCNFNFVGL